MQIPKVILVASAVVVTLALLNALREELPADPQKGHDLEVNLSAANMAASGFTATHGFVSASEGAHFDGHTEAAGTIEIIG